MTSQGREVHNHLSCDISCSLSLSLLSPKRYLIWQKKEAVVAGSSFDISDGLWLAVQQRKSVHKKGNTKRKGAPFACYHSNHNFTCLVFVLFILQL